MSEILKKEILATIKAQGFKINSPIKHSENDKEYFKKLHSVAKSKITQDNYFFLEKHKPLIKKKILSLKDIDVTKISPQLKVVVPGSQEEIFLRWWNLTWWSIPHQRSFGRSIRFLVWDKYHDVPMGIMILTSPILKQSVRDSYLEIPPKELHYWVNQSMNAQRLGALPPYNEILGGKLMALIMTSNEVRNIYQKKYKNQTTLINKEILPSKLLFLTTTSAFGRSSIYNRLKYKQEKACLSLGYTRGYGSFHIPETLFKKIITFLEENGVSTKRNFGAGPSKRIKLLSKCFSLLKIPNYTRHSIKREFFLFPLVENIHNCIKANEFPKFVDRELKDIVDFWKERYALPRLDRIKLKKTKRSIVSFINKVIKVRSFPNGIK